MLTLGKLFAPLYIKACPYNIFELKPAFWKMFAITVTVAIQVCNFFSVNNFLKLFRLELLRYKK
jgi:hypothetical protein